MKRFLKHLAVDCLIVVTILGCYFLTVRSETRAVISSALGSPLYYGRQGAALCICLGEGTEATLEILGEKGVKATFFVSEEFWEDTELLTDVVSQGHELALLGPEEGELSGYAERFEKQMQIAGVPFSRLFMPYAQKTGLFEGGTGIAGYQTVICGVDSLDTQDIEAEQIVISTTRNLKQNSFVLLHAEQKTAGILAEILDSAKEAGIAFMTVSEAVA